MEVWLVWYKKGLSLISDFYISMKNAKVNAVSKIGGNMGITMVQGSLDVTVVQSSETD